MNDHVLLNISTVTGKWFRKFVFNFNLTGVYNNNPWSKLPISRGQVSCMPQLRRSPTSKLRGHIGFGLSVRPFVTLFDAISYEPCMQGF